MAYYGLEHVLRLGPAFHSGSTTGTLARMLDRGVLQGGSGVASGWLKPCVATEVPIGLLYLPK